MLKRTLILVGTMALAVAVVSGILERLLSPKVEDRKERRTLAGPQS